MPTMRVAAKLRLCIIREAHAQVCRSWPDQTYPSPAEMTAALLDCSTEEVEAALEAGRQDRAA